MKETDDGFVGSFNKNVHAKVFDADQGAENKKMPWISPPNIGKSTSSRCNGLIQSMKEGDCSLIACGSRRGNRGDLKQLMDAHKADEDPSKMNLKALEDFFIYQRGAPGIQAKGMGGNGEVEPINISTCGTDKHPCRMRRVARRNGTGTSNQLAFLNMKRRHHKDLPQLLPDAKRAILSWLKNGVDCSTIKEGEPNEVLEKARRRKSFKSVKGSLPLSWRSKDPECWAEVLVAVHAGKVTDFHPGDFSCGLACIILGLPYTAICCDETHAKFGQKVLQQAIIHRMQDKESWCYAGEQVAENVAKHFPALIETEIHDEQEESDSSGSE